MNLEGVDIFQVETIRRAAKIPAELRYRVEIRLLRRRRQIADRHVLDHAAAKRADLSHRKTSCLKGWAAKTHDPFRQEATALPRKRLRSINVACLRSILNQSFALGIIKILLQQYLPYANIATLWEAPQSARNRRHFGTSRDHQLGRPALVSSATFLMCAIAVLAPAVLVSRSSVASLSSPTGASARSI